MCRFVDIDPIFFFHLLLGRKTVQLSVLRILDSSTRHIRWRGGGDGDCTVIYGVR